MKKTSSRIMAIAMTVALLACLIVGVLPVSAAAPTGVTASATPTTISANATYNVTFDPTSALANPTAAVLTVLAAGTINVTAGDTITFVGPANLTFTTADPVVWQSGAANFVSVAAFGVLPVAAGDRVKFSVTNVITSNVGNTYYNQMPPTGPTFANGLIVLKFSAGFPLPQIILPANVTVYRDDTLPLGFPPTLNDAVVIPDVHVAVNNVTNEVAIAIAGWPSSPGQRVRVVIANLTNPGTLGDFVISAKSTVDSTYADAAAITISPAVVPGQISIYNAAGNFLGVANGFGGTDNRITLSDGVSFVVLGDGYKLTLTPATYTLISDWNVTAANVQIVPTTGSNVDTIINGAFTIGLNGTGDTINNIKFAAATPTGTPAALSLGGTNNTASNIVTSGAITIAAGSTGATITNTTTTTTISVNGTGFNITNSTIDLSSTTSQKVGISLDNGAVLAGTISGNTFKVSQPTTAPANLSGDVAIKVGALGAGVRGVTITNNTFTGIVGGVGYMDTVGAGTVAAPMKITKNTFTSLETAAAISAAGANVTFSNNTVDKTITNNVSPSVNWIGALEISGGAAVAVNSNVISNSAGYSIDIANGATTDITVIGNDFHANAKGLNNSGVGALSAVQNWWGSATGPKNATLNPAGVGDPVSANVTFVPFLGILPTAGGSATSTAGPPPANYDFQTTSGVAIIGFSGAGIIVTEKLSGNPTGVTPLYPVLTGGYFEVYTSVASTTAFQIKFYAPGLTTSTQVYYWSAISNSWVLCSSQGVAGTGDFVFVNVGLGGAGVAPSVNDLLQGTPFVLVAGPATTPAAFPITAPAINSDQPLTNISFTWAPVAGATSYEFILANNSTFAIPYTATSAALTLPVYQYTGANLVAGSTYYWRVIARQGSTVIGNSPIGYFRAVTSTTTAPPVTVTTTTTSTPPATTVTTTAPAVTVTPTVITTSIITIPPAVTTIQPQPTIIITTNPPVTITFTQPQPTITTISIPAVPAVTQITPAWIWGIIGIGAILIIVVIVLIVRTRRAV